MAIGVSGRVSEGGTTKLRIRFTEPGTKPSSFNEMVESGLISLLFKEKLIKV